MWEILWASFMFFAVSNRAIGFCFLPAKSKLKNWPDCWGSQMQCGVGGRKPRDLLRGCSTVAGLRFPEAQEHIFTMEEVLSKTSETKPPLEQMEFYELSLLDEANELGTRHRIRQAHVAWNEIEGDLMSDHEEVEYFWILTAAKQRYEERRRALADKGFIYSDMDPIL